MLSCIMIGDSIAVGVGQARPECETIAQVGITSARYIATLLPPARIDVDTAVISLGVNDDATLDTLDNLRQVRSRVQAHSVVWLLPGLKDNVREMIRQVAAEHGDRTLDTRPQAGRDHLHPTGTGYEIIASNIIGPRDGEEVADYVPSRADRVDRPLGTGATPRDRIRRLRTLRQAQLGHTQVGHAQVGHSQVEPIHVQVRPGVVAPSRATPHGMTHAAARTQRQEASAQRQEGGTAARVLARPVTRTSHLLASCSGTGHACQQRHRSRA